MDIRGEGTLTLTSAFYINVVCVGPGRIENVQYIDVSSRLHLSTQLQGEAKLQCEKTKVHVLEAN